MAAVQSLLPFSRRKEEREIRLKDGASAKKLIPSPKGTKTVFITQASGTGVQLLLFPQLVDNSQHGLEMCHLLCQVP